MKSSNKMTGTTLKLLTITLDGEKGIFDDDALTEITEIILSYSKAPTHEVYLVIKNFKKIVSKLNALSIKIRDQINYIEIHGTKSIPEEFLSHMSHLKNCIFGDGCETFNKWIFKFDDELEVVQYPKTAKSIYNQFRGCRFKNFRTLAILSDKVKASGTYTGGVPFHNCKPKHFMIPKAIVFNNDLYPNRADEVIVFNGTSNDAYNFKTTHFKNKDNFVATVASNYCTSTEVNTPAAEPNYQEDKLTVQTIGDNPSIEDLLKWLGGE